MLNTIESTFEHNIQLAIRRFRKEMDSELKGEELQDQIWENKDMFGEIMFNLIDEYCGFEDIE